MKPILFFISMLCSLSSIGQLEQIVLESHNADPSYAPEGYHVFRLYADLVNSDDFVRSVSSTNDCATLEIKTAGSFYNSEIGESVASSSLANLSALFPEVLEDTYLTIGIDENYSGSENLDVFVNISDSLALYNSFEQNPGSNLILQDGGIAIINPESSLNGYATGPENRVLLAQLTANGKIYYKINLEVLVHGDPENVINYVWQITDNCGEGNLQTGEQFGLIKEYFYCDDPLALNYDPDPPEDGINSPEGCSYNFIEGCTDPFACNYAQEYNLDDGSCIYPDGCLDQFACNYDPFAMCDDGSCEYDNCLGCTNPSACNYDLTALFDDGSCHLPDGCTDSLACNYEFWADCDDGSCEYLSCLGCVDIGACNFNSEALIDDGSCEYLSCLGCTDSLACNFDSSALIDDATCLLPDGCSNELACNYSPFAMCDDGSCEFDSCLGCTDPLAMNYSNLATVDDGSCIYPCGGELLQVSWTSGSFVSEISWVLEEIESATEPTYFSPEVLTQDLTFEWCLNPGCYRLVMSDEFGDGWNGSSISYELEGVYIEHSLEYGSSSFDIISVGSDCEIDGCTNSLASNFNSLATLDDGSCLYETVPGASEENKLQIRLSLLGWNGSDDATVTFTNLNLIENAEFIVQDISGKILWDALWLPMESEQTLPLKMLKGDGWYLFTLRQGNQKVSSSYLKLSSG